MNFNEFVNEVKDNIRLFLPKDYENAEVSTMECQKLNRAYTGLMVRKEGEMLTPTINLNQLYEAYKAQPGVGNKGIFRVAGFVTIRPIHQHFPPDIFLAAQKSLSACTVSCFSMY